MFKRLVDEYRLDDLIGYMLVRIELEDDEGESEETTGFVCFGCKVNR